MHYRKPVISIARNCARLRKLLRDRGVPDYLADRCVAHYRTGSNLSSMFTGYVDYYHWLETARVENLIWLISNYPIVLCTHIRR